jgi:drug/metabolite transporter (DMT)-like permease
MSSDTRHPVRLLVCLGAVYFIWGSSFLFSKIAVTHLPVAMLSGIRFLTAGTILALVARFWKGDRVPEGARELRQVAILGFLMVFASNGANIWAIQYMPTNESALLNSTAAFWIAGLGVFGRRGHPLTRRAVVGLVVGFIGTAVMLLPNGHIDRSNLIAKGAALGGCFSWSLGTLYYRSIDTRVSPLMLTAMQMLAGGAMLSCVALAGGQAAEWSMNAPGLIALGYLTLFSSCLAYTAYGWLTRNATPALIGTYGYVNPAIAAFLGWYFLDEHLTRLQLAGMVVIIVGVALLTMKGGSVLDPKTLEEPKSQ